MIQSAQDLVLFTSPYFLLGLFLIALLWMVEDFFYCHGLFRVFAVIALAIYIVLAVFAGAKAQEIILAILLLVLLESITRKIHKVLPSGGKRG
jgi:hypothetical protein